MPDDKSVLQRVKDAISRREDPKDKKTRVGSGGRTRARKIDELLDEAETGRRRENQSTDSNQ